MKTENKIGLLRKMAWGTSTACKLKSKGGSFLPLCEKVRK